MQPDAAQLLDAKLKLTESLTQFVSGLRGGPLQPVPDDGGFSQSIQDFANAWGGAFGILFMAVIA